MAPSPSSLQLRRFAFGRMCFWGAQLLAVPFVFALARHWWLQISVLYLVEVSLYANMATDYTAWQAARVEVKVDTDSGRLEGVNVDSPGPVETAGT